MIESIDEVTDPFATVTIELFDDPDNDAHIPLMEITFLEGYPKEISHVISLRDSVALLLYKMDMMIERADGLVIIDDIE